jgi:hypothetical protein
MTLTNYGQPVGGIIQYAYIVENIEQAMRQYTELMHVGPWFLAGPFKPPRGRYRGKPTELEVSLAIAFSGHVMIELIQQHNDVPSVFREIIEQRGYGFHHNAIITNDFDADVEKYSSQGFEIAFSDEQPGKTRIAYFDTTAVLPGMLEITELTPATEARHTRAYLASVGWDGIDPVRRMTL